MSDKQSSLLFLDTSHSISPSNPSDTTFILQDLISARFDDFVLSFESAQIPNLVYPVNEYTDKVYFSENGGGTITATLTRQNYDATQLAVEIAAQMTALTGIAETYIGTFNSQTKKITIATTNPANTLQFIDGVNNSDEVSGLIPMITFQIGGTTGQQTVRLDGSRHVDIVSSLNTGNYSSNGYSNILFRIPLNVSYGNIIFFQNATQDFLNVTNNSLQTLSFRLLDDAGRLWTLPANASWGLTLKLTPVY